MRELIESLENLYESAAAPSDLIAMLEYAIPVIKAEASDFDLSDRKDAVKVWGFLHGLITHWGMGPAESAYKRQQKFFKNPPSEETSEWIRSVTDARYKTQIKKALKKKWPEASEWMLKHKMK